MKFIILSILLCVSTTGFAQKDKTKKELNEKETKDILKQVMPDSTALLRSIGEETCDCIDSMQNVTKGKKNQTEGVSKCIEDKTTAYQLLIKLRSSMLSNDKGNKTISLNINKESNEYTRYYREIQVWLKDSCRMLNTILAANDDENENSYSKNPLASSEYNLGIDLMQKSEFERALPFFEKAVEIDNKFAFAWDNIGICNRRLGNYDKALKAYETSLKLDPNGITPMHNIPVVYEYLKKYDKALEAYQNIAKVDKEDPETFFGAGRVYFVHKEDMEKALDNMCKAYNLYVKQKSAYRVDAQNFIQLIYSKMKEQNKLDAFQKILKDNNISTSKD
jgi:tetratricopeptide (TPR) repeat protein